MKNLILLITSIVTIIAILEAAGIIEWIDKDTYQVVGYCDNSNRGLSEGNDGGGYGIDRATTEKYMEEWYNTMRENPLHVSSEYFLSKNALDYLFNNDNRATGIIIAPFIDEDKKMNVLVSNAHNTNTKINTEQGGFSFVIKTFCPTMCEVIARPLPTITGTP